MRTRTVRVAVSPVTSSADMKMSERITLPAAPWEDPEESHSALDERIRNACHGDSRERVAARYGISLERVSQARGRQ